MFHNFNISAQSTPNLYRAYNIINKEQQDRLNKKISGFKYPDKIVNDIEKMIEKSNIAFNHKDFEKQFATLITPILKPKLTIDMQIEKLKIKGVTFNATDMDENNAKNFLTNNTFYYKLTAYRKNFEKSDDKYIDLDFSYLVDLSIMDMHTKNEVLKICSCIEHAIKTKLLRDFDISTEDGYQIVKDFCIYAKKIPHPINQSSIDKFKHKAIWQIVEEVTLSELFKLCDYFYKKHTRNSQVYIKIKNLSKCIIDLRNAVSHNNCLINDLNKNQLTRATDEIVDYLYIHCFKNDKSIYKFKKNIEDMLTNKFINNFLGCLLALDYISSSQKIKYHRYKEILLLKHRIKKNKHYYRNNKIIKPIYYIILKTILHFYCKNIR
ncbi:MAG: Abi family protein [Campylobacteraceae bacterium]|jgi:hypothetical protein|nr:Abi family protein [Campylobacteraceae bacterium]